MAKTQHFCTSIFSCHKSPHCTEIYHHGNSPLLCVSQPRSDNRPLPVSLYARHCVAVGPGQNAAPAQSHSAGSTSNSSIYVMRGRWIETHCHRFRKFIKYWYKSYRMYSLIRYPLDKKERGIRQAYLVHSWKDRGRNVQCKYPVYVIKLSHS